MGGTSNVGLVLILVIKRHGVTLRVSVIGGVIDRYGRGWGKSNVDQQSEGRGIGVIVGKVAREYSISDSECSVNRGRNSGGWSQSQGKHLTIDSYHTIWGHPSGSHHICAYTWHLLRVATSVISAPPSIVLSSMGLLYGFASHATTHLNAVGGEVTLLFSIQTESRWFIPIYSSKGH